MRRRTRILCGVSAALALGLTACGNGGTRRDNWNDANGDSNNQAYTDDNGAYGDGSATGEQENNWRDNWNNANNAGDSFRDDMDDAGDRMRDDMDDAGDNLRSGMDNMGDSLRNGMNNMGDRIRDALDGATATPTAADEITRRAHEALTGTTG